MTSIIHSNDAAGRYCRHRNHITVHTMSSAIFQFGEQRPEYSVPVLNERAVRASAGILFFFAMLAFMQAWLLGNFGPTRVFVIAFLVEFTLRLVINPRFAPVLIVGQWVVRHQQPEYVGAAQKRFAWAIGWLLALSMLYLVVLNQMIGPVNLLVCASCLLLLFFESAFGICLGCRLYNAFHQEKARLCPGGACDLPVTSRTSAAQAALVLAFLVFVAGSWSWVYHRPSVTAANPPSAERCKVPDFAKAMGHEDQWRLHNACQ